MLKPRLVTPPSGSPVSLDEVKQHLNVDFTDDDAKLEIYITAAAEYLDGWSGILGRCILSQQWSQGFYGFCESGALRLPFPDVTAVAVSYYDAAGDLQILPPESYELLADGIGSFIQIKRQFSLPALDCDRAEKVTATLTAGMAATPDKVPKPIKQAILLLVGSWYENRETASNAATFSALPMGFDALIAAYKIKEF